MDSLSIGLNGRNTAKFLDGKVFVADLITHFESGNHWNEGLVRTIWDESIANQILQIPLGGLALDVGVMSQPRNAR